MSGILGIPPDPRIPDKISGKRGKVLKISGAVYEDFASYTEYLVRYTGIRCMRHFLSGIRGFCQVERGSGAGVVRYSKQGFSCITDVRCAGTVLILLLQSLEDLTAKEIMSKKSSATVQPLFRCQCYKQSHFRLRTFFQYFCKT